MEWERADSSVGARAGADNGKGAPRVMVIDDEPDFCTVVGELLGISHMEVQKAYSADEAVDLMEKRTPDLILTDVMMPGQDGLTFLRHVKARPDWQAIPAIVVSACVRQEDREAALRAGADAFLPKPFSWEQLRRAIAPYLSTWA
jgi:CheY-like chemotaxis protein